MAGPEGNPGAPVALVTGGVRGIGRAVTERLLADGWSVVATYRADEGAAADLASAHPALVVRRADVTCTADCDETVAQAIARFGALDHLVHCAATTAEGPASELDDSTWDAVVATNLSGAFRAIRPALAPIATSGRGRIVLVSSVAATMGSAGRAAYAASKAGLHGLGRSLAQELASQGVTVNVVVPGPTEGGGMTAVTDRAFVEAIARRIPLGRIGRPEEVAHAVRYLLDDRAAFVTGTTVVVDGGLSM